MPVYNGACTVHKMIDSIILQSYHNWELIAVDDGSSDNTFDILTQYAEKDHRIKVIHKENGGVASARQTGLENVSGQYIIHTDADDWIEPSMLKDMLHHINKSNADIVIADYYSDKSGEKSELISQHTDCLNQIILKSLFSGHLHGSLCNKLIKSDLFKKYSISFEPGINYCEDLLVLTKILMHPEVKVSYLNKGYYHYVLDGDSITRSTSPKAFESLCRFHKIAEALLSKEEGFENIHKEFDYKEFIIFFTNKLYHNNKELKAKLKNVRDTAKRRSGLRWKLGFSCIDMGLISLSHKLIKF